MKELVETRLVVSYYVSTHCSRQGKSGENKYFNDSHDTKCYCSGFFSAVARFNFRCADGPRVRNVLFFGFVLAPSQPPSEPATGVQNLSNLVYLQYLYYSAWNLSSFDLWWHVERSDVAGYTRSTTNVVAVPFRFANDAMHA